ncbi:hypothetical protein FJW08_21300 [Mesorhizobium sp. B3-2-1]|uniref:hypothetical protein n=1 Tax=Mesorhizobium sp. B3-2-1 TaxID=2589891 RepID=UPI0011278B98|nr:hypothetical protein [Mesorhizobium sp. B3-2-1]TPI28313.1 hypothetical protein FJW08_21300 [Mesorhizobium sp. B3-2-1]
MANATLLRLCEERYLLSENETKLKTRGADLLNTQTSDQETQAHTIGFTVRLTQDDLDPITRSWRCPALELPGASLQEVYADGERIDPEKYRVVRNQVRWIGEKPPEKLAAVVNVDSETSEEVFQSRNEAKKNEDWWRKFGTIVPLITAALAAGVSLYLSKGPAPSPPSPTPHTLTMRIAPVDFDKRMPSPRISVNEQVIATPYMTSLNTDMSALIDLSDSVNLVDAFVTRDKRTREFLAKVVQSLASVDDPLTKASSNIIDSCPGGGHGQTPGNGPATIGLINSARDATTQLKAEADSLANEQTPK